MHTVWEGNEGSVHRQPHRNDPVVPSQSLLDLAGADRRRAGRQIVAYWLVSLVSMTISSVATGVVSGTAPRDRVLHLAILGSGYLVISFVLWIAKYLVYESAIFRHQAPSTDSIC